MCSRHCVSYFSSVAILFLFVLSLFSIYGNLKKKKKQFKDSPSVSKFRNSWVQVSYKYTSMDSVIFIPITLTNTRILSLLVSSLQRQTKNYSTYSVPQSSHCPLSRQRKSSYLKKYSFFSVLLCVWLSGENWSHRRWVERCPKGTSLPFGLSWGFLAGKHRLGREALTRHQEPPLRPAGGRLERPTLSRGPWRHSTAPAPPSAQASGRKACSCVTWATPSERCLADLGPAALQDQAVPAKMSQLESMVLCREAQVSTLKSLFGEVL